MSEPEVVSSDTALVVVGPPKEPADIYNAWLGRTTLWEAAQVTAWMREAGGYACACIGCEVHGCWVCHCSHLRAQRTALMDAGSIVARLVRDRIDQKLDEREEGQ